jgi:hypothetical protein
MPSANQGGPRPGLPKPGDVLLVDEAASVQFAGNNRLLFRVTRVHDWTTYHGWLWLSGYALDRQGAATEQRQIWVQVAGLKRAQLPPPARRGPGGSGR